MGTFLGVGGTIEDILEEIPNIDDPLLFKHRYLEIIQLFSDGIIGTCIPDEPKQIFKELCDIGTHVVGSYYLAGELDKAFAVDYLHKQKGTLISYAAKSTSKPRHLAYASHEIQGWGASMRPIVDANSYDHIVCVANGGYEPSFLLMEIAGITDLTPIRFSNYNLYENQDIEPQPLRLANGTHNEMLQNKRILVVEDLVCTGESLAKVMAYVHSHSPAILHGTAVRINDYHKPEYVESVVSDLPFLCNMPTT